MKIFRVILDSYCDFSMLYNLIVVHFISATLFLCYANFRLLYFYAAFCDVLIWCCILSKKHSFLYYAFFKLHYFYVAFFSHCIPLQFSCLWHSCEVVISNVQRHSTTSRPRFHKGSYPTCRVLKISKWWESLTAVLARDKAYRFSSVNSYPKTVHHHHVALFPGFTIFSCTFSPHASYITLL